MNYEYNIWVLGGDRRMFELSRLLCADGHQAHSFAQEEASGAGCVLRERNLEGIGLADAVVLPLPAASSPGQLFAPLSRQGCALEDVFRRLRPEQFLCGGRLDPGSLALAKARGLTLRDYFAREELAVANAVPTAEGCLQLAMEELPITLHGARVLILGYGRVGRACAQRFGALGARVTVAARRYELLAWAQASGFDCERIEELAGGLCGYDLLVNTVPAQVLGEAELADLRGDCLIIDLSSAPGGVDLAAARRRGVRVLQAPGLPGKVAPVSAAEAIQYTLYHMLRERET